MPARVKTAVRPRLAILLVHGMGVGPDWWYPIASSLRRFRVTVRALKMPSLETAGPAAWCVAILRELPRGPAILVGHSLGAAVCLEVGRRRRVEGLVMLACPPFFADFTPPEPPETDLSAGALRRVARFLRRVCQRAGAPPGHSVHFVGTADPWVPVPQARRLPVPLVAIPGAGHALNRSPRLVKKLARQLILSGATKRSSRKAQLNQRQAAKLPGRKAG